MVTCSVVSLLNTVCSSLAFKWAQIPGEAISRGQTDRGGGGGGGWIQGDPSVELSGPKWSLNTAVKSLSLYYVSSFCIHLKPRWSQARWDIYSDPSRQVLGPPQGLIPGGPVQEAPCPNPLSSSWTTEQLSSALFYPWPHSFGHHQYLVINRVWNTDGKLQAPSFLHRDPEIIRDVAPASPCML